jgi:filamentous hemagglutinin
VVTSSALDALGSTGKTSFTPTQAQIDSSAFKVIVGDARYTPSGAPVGTIYDATVRSSLGEIKTGSSVLKSSYQLRLQTYGSLVNDTPLTIYTSRPLSQAFGDWLARWGVQVKPLLK